MLEVGWFSTKLLLKGKLLRNPGYFYRQITIGIVFGLFLLVGIREIGINPLFAVIFSSLLLGMAMPFLLKDLKLQ